MSLRTRLALGYGAFFALVLALTTLGSYLLVRQALLSQARDELRVGADLVLAGFAQSSTLPADYFRDPAVFDALLAEQIEGLERSPLYVQAFGNDGTLLAASPNLRGQVLPLSQEVVQAALRGEPLEQVESLGTARVLGHLLPLELNGQPVGVLHVATSLQAIDRTLTILLLSTLVGDGIALLAALRGGAWLARGALAPVDAVVQTTRQIVRADDLHRRVPEVATDDEIGRLTRTINELLARLETLFTQQQRFIADVSHELRTPLTAMRGNLELLRGSMANDPQLRDESLADMDHEVQRLTRMANDLLLLAQAEAGVALPMAPVALDDLLLEVYREFQPLAHHLTLRVDIAAQLAVTGDRDRLKQALLNLGANALQHTPAGGSVTLTLGTEGGWACIAVRDTGTGIAPEALPQLFERFYRADKARLRHRSGAGLGLAIVKWVAEAHGGQVLVESVLGQGSTFTLRLPLPSMLPLAPPRLRLGATAGRQSAARR